MQFAETQKGAAEGTMIKIGKVVAAIVMLLDVAAKVACAAEPGVIVLACDGMMTTTDGQHQNAPQAVNQVGVVVNLTEGTVSFAGSIAHIDSVDAAFISFGTDEVLREEVPHRATGDIDRVTGAMSAATISGTVLSSYELACKAASRAF
jgi:hypothetical protein